MCRNSRMTASTEKPKHLNPEAKEFNPCRKAKASDHHPNTFKLPHHFFHNQPRLLLPPPPLPAAAASPVILSSPAFIHYHPVYYNPVCKYDIHILENTSKPPEKAHSGRGSLYPSGGLVGFTAAGGGERAAAAVTKRRTVTKKPPRHAFVFQEKTFVKRWRPKGQFKHQLYPPPATPPPAAATSLSPSVDVSAWTTIMIKNIPNQFRRNTLLDFLDSQCRQQSDPLPMAYDFLYLPMDFRTGDNLGYAFLNLTNAEAAVRMSAILNQYKWGLCSTSSGSVFESKKICEITWAKIQGKDNLYSHFKNSKFTCRNSEYLPVVLTPPRNGSTSLTVPTTIGNCLASGLGDN